MSFKTEYKSIPFQFQGCKYKEHRNGAKPKKWNRPIKKRKNQYPFYCLNYQKCMTAHRNLVLDCICLSIKSKFCLNSYTSTRCKN